MLSFLLNSIAPSNLIKIMAHWIGNSDTTLLTISVCGNICTPLYINQLSPIYNNNSPLIHAIVEKNHDALDLLLEHPDLNLNFPNSYGRTPLHAAISLDNIYALSKLLDRDDIDVNITDKKGETPLHNAVIGKNVVAVKMLLEHPEVDVRILDNQFQPPYVYITSNTPTEIAECFHSFNEKKWVKSAHSIELNCQHESDLIGDQTE